MESSDNKKPPIGERSSSPDPNSLPRSRKTDEFTHSPYNDYGHSPYLEVVEIIPGVNSKPFLPPETLDIVDGIRPSSSKTRGVSHLPAIEESLFEDREEVGIGESRSASSLSDSLLPFLPSSLIPLNSRHSLFSRVSCTPALTSISEEFIVRISNPIPGSQASQSDDVAQASGRKRSRSQCDETKHGILQGFGDMAAVKSKDVTHVRVPDSLMHPSLHLNGSLLAKTGLKLRAGGEGIERYGEDTIGSISTNTSGCSDELRMKLLQLDTSHLWGYFGENSEEVTQDRCNSHPTFSDTTCDGATSKEQDDEASEIPSHTEPTVSETVFQSAASHGADGEGNSGQQYFTLSESGYEGEGAQHGSRAASSPEQWQGAYLNSGDLGNESLFRRIGEEQVIPMGDIITTYTTVTTQTCAFKKTSAASKNKFAEEPDGTKLTLTPSSNRPKNSGSASVIADTAMSSGDVSAPRESFSEHTTGSASSERQDKDFKDKESKKQRDKDTVSKQRGRERERNKRKRDREERGISPGKQKSLRNAVGDMQRVDNEPGAGEKMTRIVDFGFLESVKVAPRQSGQDAIAKEFSETPSSGINQKNVKIIDMTNFVEASESSNRNDDSGDVRDHSMKTTCGLESQTVTSQSDDSSMGDNRTSRNRLRITESSDTQSEEDKVGEEALWNVEAIKMSTSRFGKRTALHRQKQLVGLNNQFNLSSSPVLSEHTSLILASHSESEKDASDINDGSQQDIESAPNSSAMQEFETMGPINTTDDVTDSTSHDSCLGGGLLHKRHESLNSASFASILVCAVYNESFNHPPKYSAENMQGDWDHSSESQTAPLLDRNTLEEGASGGSMLDHNLSVENSENTALIDINETFATVAESTQDAAVLMSSVEQNEAFDEEKQLAMASPSDVVSGWPVEWDISADTSEYVTAYNQDMPQNETSGSINCFQDHSDVMIKEGTQNEEDPFCDNKLEYLAAEHVLAMGSLFYNHPILCGGDKADSVLDADDIHSCTEREEEIGSTLESEHTQCGDGLNNLVAESSQHGIDSASLLIEMKANCDGTEESTEDVSSMSGCGKYEGKATVPAMKDQFIKDISDNITEQEGGSDELNLAEDKETPHRGEILGDSIGEITGDTGDDILCKKNVDILGDNIDNIQGDNIGDIHGNNIGEIREDNIVDIPGDNIGEIPGDSISDIPGDNIFDITRKKIDDIPGDNIVEIPEDNIDDISGDNTCELQKVNIRENPRNEICNNPGDIRGDISEDKSGHIIGQVEKIPFSELLVEKQVALPSKGTEQTNVNEKVLNDITYFLSVQDDTLCDKLNNSGVQENEPRAIIDKSGVQEETHNTKYKYGVQEEEPHDTIDNFSFQEETLYEPYTYGVQEEELYDKIDSSGVQNEEPHNTIETSVVQEEHNFKLDHSCVQEEPHYAKDNTYFKLDHSGVHKAVLNDTIDQSGVQESGLCEKWQPQHRVHHLITDQDEDMVKDKIQKHNDDDIVFTKLPIHDVEEKEVNELHIHEGGGKAIHQVVPILEGDEQVAFEVPTPDGGGKVVIEVSEQESYEKVAFTIPTPEVDAKVAFEVPVQEREEKVAYEVQESDEKVAFKVSVQESDVNLAFEVPNLEGDEKVTFEVPTLEGGEKVSFEVQLQVVDEKMTSEEPVQEGDVKLAFKVPTPESDENVAFDVPILKDSEKLVYDIPSQKRDENVTFEVPIQNDDEKVAFEVPIQEGDMHMASEVLIQEGDENVLFDVPLQEGDEKLASEVAAQEANETLTDNARIQVIQVAVMPADCITNVELSEHESIPDARQVETENVLESTPFNSTTTETPEFYQDSSDLVLSKCPTTVEQDVERVDHAMTTTGPGTAVDNLCLDVQNIETDLGFQRQHAQKKYTSALTTTDSEIDVHRQNLAAAEEFDNKENDDVVLDKYFHIDGSVSSDRGCLNSDVMGDQDTGSNDLVEFRTISVSVLDLQESFKSTVLSHKESIESPILDELEAIDFTVSGYQETIRSTVFSNEEGMEFAVSGHQEVGEHEAIKSIDLAERDVNETLVVEQTFEQKYGSSKDEVELMCLTDEQNTVDAEDTDIKSDQNEDQTTEQTAAKLHDCVDDLIEPGENDANEFQPESVETDDDNYLYDIGMMETRSGVINDTVDAEVVTIHIDDGRDVEIKCDFIKHTESNEYVFTPADNGLGYSDGDFTSQLIQRDLDLSVDGDGGQEAQNVKQISDGGVMRILEEDTQGFDVTSDLKNFKDGDEPIYTFSNDEMKDVDCRSFVVVSESGHEQTSAADVVDTEASRIQTEDQVDIRIIPGLNKVIEGDEIVFRFPENVVSEDHVRPECSSHSGQGEVVCGCVENVQKNVEPELVTIKTSDFAGHEIKYNLKKEKIGDDVMYTMPDNGNWEFEYGVDNGEMNSDHYNDTDDNETSITKHGGESPEDFEFNQSVAKQEVKKYFYFKTFQDNLNPVEMEITNEGIGADCAEVNDSNIAAHSNEVPNDFTKGKDKKKYTTTLTTTDGVAVNEFKKAAQSEEVEDDSRREKHKRKYTSTLTTTDNYTDGHLKRGVEEEEHSKDIIDDATFVENFASGGNFSRDEDFRQTDFNNLDNSGLIECEQFSSFQKISGVPVTDFGKGNYVENNGIIMEAQNEEVVQTVDTEIVDIHFDDRHGFEVAYELKKQKEGDEYVFTPAGAGSGCPDCDITGHLNHGNLDHCLGDEGLAETQNIETVCQMMDEVVPIHCEDPREFNVSYDLKNEKDGDEHLDTFSDSGARDVDCQSFTVVSQSGHEQTGVTESDNEKTAEVVDTEFGRFHKLCQEGIGTLPVLNKAFEKDEVVFTFVGREEEDLDLTRGGQKCRSDQEDVLEQSVTMEASRLQEIEVVAAEEVRILFDTRHGVRVTHELDTKIEGDEVIFTFSNKDGDVCDEECLQENADSKSIQQNQKESNHEKKNQVSPEVQTADGTAAELRDGVEDLVENEATKMRGSQQEYVQINDENCSDKTGMMEAYNEDAMNAVNAETLNLNVEDTNGVGINYGFKKHIGGDECVFKPEDHGFGDADADIAGQPFQRDRDDGLDDMDKQETSHVEHPAGIVSSEQGGSTREAKHDIDVGDGLSISEIERASTEDLATIDDDNIQAMEMAQNIEKDMDIFAYNLTDKEPWGFEVRDQETQPENFAFSSSPMKSLPRELKRDSGREENEKIVISLSDADCKHASNDIFEVYLSDGINSEIIEGNFVGLDANAWKNNAGDESVMSTDSVESIFYVNETGFGETCPRHETESSLCGEAQEGYRIVGVTSQIENNIRPFVPRDNGLEGKGNATNRAEEISVRKQDHTDSWCVVPDDKLVVSTDGSTLDPDDHAETRGDYQISSSEWQQETQKENVSAEISYVETREDIQISSPVGDTKKQDYISMLSPIANIEKQKDVQISPPIGQIETQRDTMTSASTSHKEKQTVENTSAAHCHNEALGGFHISAPTTNDNTEIHVDESYVINDATYNVRCPSDSQLKETTTDTDNDTNSEDNAFSVEYAREAISESYDATNVIKLSSSLSGPNMQQRFFSADETQRLVQNAASRIPDEEILSRDSFERSFNQDLVTPNNFETEGSKNTDTDVSEKEQTSQCGVVAENFDQSSCQDPLSGEGQGDPGLHSSSINEVDSYRPALQQKSEHVYEEEKDSTARDRDFTEENHSGLSLNVRVGSLESTIVDENVDCGQESHELEAHKVTLHEAGMEKTCDTCIPESVLNSCEQDYTDGSDSIVYDELSHREHDSINVATRDGLNIDKADDLSKQTNEDIQRVRGPLVSRFESERHYAWKVMSPITSKEINIGGIGNVQTDAEKGLREDHRNIMVLGVGTATEDTHDSSQDLAQNLSMVKTEVKEASILSAEEEIHIPRIACKWDDSSLQKGSREHTEIEASVLTMTQPVSDMDRLGETVSLFAASLQCRQIASDMGDGRNFEKVDDMVAHTEQIYMEELEMSDGLNMYPDTVREVKSELSPARYVSDKEEDTVPLVKESKDGRRRVKKGSMAKQSQNLMDICSDSTVGIRGSDRPQVQKTRSTDVCTLLKSEGRREDDGSEECYNLRTTKSTPVPQSGIRRIKVIDVKEFPKDMPCIYRPYEMNEPKPPAPSASETNLSRPNKPAICRHRSSEARRPKKTSIWKRLKSILKAPRLTHRDGKFRFVKKFKKAPNSEMSKPSSNMSSTASESLLDQCQSVSKQHRSKVKIDERFNFRPVTAERGSEWQMESPTKPMQGKKPSKRNEWRQFRRLRILRRSAETMGPILPPMRTQNVSSKNYVRMLSENYQRAQESKYRQGCEEEARTKRSKKRRSKSRSSKRVRSPLLEHPKDDVAAKRCEMVNSATPEVFEVFCHEDEDTSTVKVEPTVRMLLPVIKPSRSNTSDPDNMHVSDDLATKSHPCAHLNEMSHIHHDVFKKQSTFWRWRCVVM